MVRRLLKREAQRDSTTATTTWPINFFVAAVFFVVVVVVVVVVNVVCNLSLDVNLYCKDFAHRMVLASFISGCITYVRHHRFPLRLSCFLVFNPSDLLM